MSTAFSLVAVLTLLTGCEGLSGNSFNPNHGLIDPSEVGATARIGKGGHLLVPILDRLPNGVEEPDDLVENATDVRPEDLVVESNDYTVGKSDLLNVSINDLVGPQIETVKQVKVTESGNISLPLVGSIKVEGYTEAQLEQIIAAKYRDAQIINNAQVAVTVVEARNRTFQISGSVQQAGLYPIPKSDFRLLDAIVTARDLTVDVDLRGNRGIEYVYVIRKLKETDTGGKMAPATSPMMPPASQPDILAPKSSKATFKHEIHAMIDDPAMPATTPAPAEPAAPTAAAVEPATAPAAETPVATPAMEPATTTPPAAAESEGRYVIVDGKPVLVHGPAAANEPVMEPASPSTQGFAFDDLKEPTDVRIIRIPIGGLKQGQLRYNIVIKPDDFILVKPPTQGEYYMGGHVARVGVYSLTARKITLKEAVISAGMLDQLAVPGRTQIVRRIGADKEVFVSVNLEKIFAGQEPDLFLKPDDQVTVGTNAIMPFLAAARGAFRLTYGFGFLYDRNYANYKSGGV